MEESQIIELEDQVNIKISGELGRVTGIAFYSNNAPQFQVHYKDAHGCARTEWFGEDALEIVIKADQ